MHQQKECFSLNLRSNKNDSWSSKINTKMMEVPPNTMADLMLAYVENGLRFTGKTQKESLGNYRNGCRHRMGIS
jgi:hypothetical protein